MRKNPCYGCVAPKRHIGCHSTCNDYVDGKLEYNVYKEAENKFRQEKSADIEMDKERARRVRNSRRKR